MKSTLAILLLALGAASARADVRTLPAYHTLPFPLQCWGEGRGPGQAPGLFPGIFQPRQPQQKEPRRPSTVSCDIRIVSAVVHIYVEGINGYTSEGMKSWAGSGVVLGAEDGVGYIATNFHVVPSKNRLKVKATFQDGFSSECKPLTADPGPDVAIISFIPQANVAVPRLPMAANSPARGERVFQVGYSWWTQGRPPPAQRAGRSMGAVTTRDRAGRIPTLTLDFACNSGDSGGGIFNDKLELAGLIWGGDVEPSRVSHAVRIEDVRKLVDQCWRPRQPAVPQPAGPSQPPAAAPPPPAAAPPADPRLIETVLAKLREHDALLQDLRQKVRDVPGALKTLPTLKEAVEQAGARAEDLRKRVGELGIEIKDLGPKLRESVAPKLQDLAERLRDLDAGKLADLKATISILLSQQTTSGEGIDKGAAAIAAVAGWLPWILGIAGTGAASPLLVMLLGAVGRFLGSDRRQQVRQRQPVPDQGMPVQPDRLIPVPGIGDAQPIGIPVLSASPPATRTEYVRVPEVDAEGEAYREAMRREVQLNPDLQPLMARVESVKAELKHGAKVAARMAAHK